MLKLDLKDKCVHKYIYDLIYIYVGREHDCNSGTRGRQLRKRKWYIALKMKIFMNEDDIRKCTESCWRWRKSK
jgi:hypothetical protein